MAVNDMATATRPLILDGGTGSELRRRGMSLSRECWSAPLNLTHAELLSEIHSDYIRSGADIITANTFATSRFVLAGCGLDASFADINRSAIAAAKAVAAEAGRPILTAGSLSCLPPRFDSRAYPDPDTEYRDYVELAQCFCEHGLDLILLEMMQDPEHSVRACRAARSTGLPVWIGISVRLRSGSHDLVAYDDDRQSFAGILDAVMPFEPTGIAIMHSPLEAVLPALSELRSAWAGPSGAYPELPYSEDSAGGDHVVPPGRDFARTATSWLEQGIELIGGCCGTTPDHIAAIRALLER